jgi:HrpA-like RNA helicase
MEKPKTISEARKDLPIYEFKHQILSLVNDNLFTLVTGETGSGKST